MTPTNRLDSVPSNVLRGACVPNALAGVPARLTPPVHVLRLPTAGVAIIAAMVALLVALLIPLLGGGVP